MNDTVKNLLLDHRRDAKREIESVEFELSNMRRRVERQELTLTERRQRLADLNAALGEASIDLVAEDGASVSCAA